MELHLSTEALETIRTALENELYRGECDRDRVIEVLAALGAPALLCRNCQEPIRPSDDDLDVFVHVANRRAGSWYLYCNDGARGELTQAEA